MKIRRRILIAGSAVTLLILVLLALLPVLLRGRIEAAVQSQLSDRMAAQVTWSGTGMSLLRDFPNARLEVRDLAIVGVDAFSGDTLLSAARVRTAIDLRSAWRTLRGRGGLVVRGIEVERPAVRLVTLEDGRSSWDIMPPREPAAGETRDLAVTLRRLAVRDGRVVVHDRRSGLRVQVAGLDHTLAGDFAKARFTIRSTTSGDSVSVRFAGLPYLNRAAVLLEADVDADMTTRRFVLRNNALRVNGLELRADGSLALTDGGGEVDVAFRAPSTAFGEILSLVPAIYTNSFATLETAGTMSVSGRVHGSFGADAFPAFEIAARVDDASFRYPDLPLPARDIALDLNVTNPGGSADSTVVRVERMHVVLGSDPIDGTLVLRTPVSDPEVDARLTGRLDLANVPRTLKLDGVQELAGVIVADAAMRARQSDLEAQRYERVAASGRIEATGVEFHAASSPRAVSVERALLRLTPARAELAEFRARSGRSDVALTGSVDNLLGYALGRDVLRGSAQLTSAHIDLNEWRSDDEARAVPVPANMDVELTADVRQLTFGTLDMRSARGALRVRDRRATLDAFRLDMLGGTMAVSGWYETLDETQPRFDVRLAVTDFDVPTAFAGLATMRAMAPAAGYMHGRMSADLALAGQLGTDLSPVMSVLTGDGTLETRDIVVQDFPAFDRLAERLSIEQLRDPALRDLRSSFEVRDGRLHVKPFDVGIGPLAMTVTGSNGFDQTMDYELALRVPRTLLGADANRVAASLAAQTQRAGVELQNAPTLGIGVRLTGNVRDPQLGLDLRDAAGSTAALIEQGLRERADAATQSVEQRVDSAADAARQRAEAEAARIIEEAERRAEQVRAEARTLADRVRQEGGARADSLVAQAGSPAARIAARAAADRMRREADAQADRIVREADERAEAIVVEARQRAAALRAGEA